MEQEVMEYIKQQAIQEILSEEPCEILNCHAILENDTIIISAITSLGISYNKHYPYEISKEEYLNSI